MKSRAPRRDTRLASVCIFSMLFLTHFFRHWQGEFVEQLRASLNGDNFLYSRELNEGEIRRWSLLKFKRMITWVSHQIHKVYTLVWIWLDSSHREVLPKESVKIPVHLVGYIYIKKKVELKNLERLVHNFTFCQLLTNCDTRYLVIICIQ